MSARITRSHTKAAIQSSYLSSSALDARNFQTRGTVEEQFAAIESTARAVAQRSLFQPSGARSVHTSFGRDYDSNGDGSIRGALSEISDWEDSVLSERDFIEREDEEEVNIEKELATKANAKLQQKPGMFETVCNHRFKIAVGATLLTFTALCIAAYFSDPSHQGACEYAQNYEGVMNSQCMQKNLGKNFAKISQFALEYILKKIKP